MNTLLVCPNCEKINRVDLERASRGKPFCGNCHKELAIYAGVQDLTDVTLNKLIHTADRPVVVDFWAQWCAPCKAFAPIFTNAASQLASKFIFAKLNTEVFPKAAQEYQIRGIPTLVLFKNGVELDRQSRAMSLPMFLNYLAQCNS